MKRWYVSSTALVVVAFAALMVAGAGTAVAFQGTPEGGWYWQNPLVQGNGFNDVAVTGSSAVAVGDAGAIFTSSNGGATWTRRSSGTKVPLLAVDFVNASTGWAVGYRAVNSANTTNVASTIVKTTNGGATWAAQDLPSGGPYELTDVSFVNASDGWATANFAVTGGRTTCTILRTTDGGTTWTVAKKWQSPIDATYPKDAVQLLSQVDFVNATTGWATGWGYDASKPVGHQWGYVLLSTTDGGATWAISQFGDGTAQISAMDFTSATDGWLATASLATYVPATIWRTTDGGATWSAQTTKQGAVITHLAASASGECYATGQTQNVYDWEGFVLHSTDGGATWSQEFAQQTVRPLAVGFSSEAAVAVGSGGLFLKRNFATGAWTDSTAGVRTNLTKIQFKNANLGWAVGWKSTILRTTNGGRDWKSMKVPSGISLEGIDMVTKKIGWAVGCSGPHVPYADLDAGYGAVVLHTTDGGLHWKYQVNRNNRPGLAAVDFTDTKHGVAVGTNGFVARTTNGGHSWWYRTVGSTTLRSVAFSTASTGVALGGETGSTSANGTIWKTADGGVTWTDAKPTPTPTAPLRSVKFDSKTGFAAIGDNDQSYTSTDGATWSYAAIVPDAVVQDPPFLLCMDYAACTLGATSVVYTNTDTKWYLMDNGRIWTANPAWSGSGQDNQLKSIAVVDWLNIWTVGDSGTILSFDRLPPTTTISPSNGWVKSPMLSLSATDPKSGVAWTRWIVDPPGVVNDPTLGPTDWSNWDWQYGTTVSFSTAGDAPGTKHVIYYQSSDKVGDLEFDSYWSPSSLVPKHLWVTVDTTGPQTYAPAAASVAKGQHPALTFWVNDDLSNKADVTVVVKDSGGKTVKTLEMGWLATSQQFSAPISDWKCTLAKGTYTFSVYAKDQAGNDQAVLGSNTLTVR